MADKDTPRNIVCWAEIPVTDMTRAKAFYGAVLQQELSDNPHAPNPMADFSSGEGGEVAGHIYPGKPAPEGTGSTIHLAAPDTLEATLARVKEAGGQVVSNPVQIPAGRFAYTLDPDGNSIGIFET